jgi:oligopeptidase B
VRTVVAMGVITKPPMPKKVSHVLEAHGDKREDSYYWICDDERKSLEMLAYLAKENNYTKVVMAGETLVNPELHCLNMFCRCLS